MTSLTVQRYFSDPTNFNGLAHESIDKIRDVLASILRSAVEYGLLVNNPVENVRIPRARTVKKKSKPHVTPEQFAQIIELIPEPYVIMVYLSVWSGLSDDRRALLPRRLGSSEE